MACKPNVVTANYCRDAVIKMGGPTAAVTVVVATGPGKDAEAKDAEVKEGVAVVKSAAIQAQEKHSSENEAKADAIMKAAEAKCTAIRAEARQKVANGRQTGNQWYVGRDGSLYPDLREEEKDEIHREAEERCTATMTFAEHQTKHVRK